MTCLTPVFPPSASKPGSLRIHLPSCRCRAKAFRLASGTCEDGTRRTRPRDGPPWQVCTLTIHAASESSGYWADWERAAWGSSIFGRTRDKRLAAVKVVRPEFANHEEFRRRFAVEAAAAQRVAGHFTARVIAIDVDSRQQWIATEYVPGPTLDRWLTAYGSLPGAQVRPFAVGLAEAVSAIHTARIVHRDLKPANVILSPTGPRVIDFGIARAADGTALTRTGLASGPQHGWHPNNLGAKRPPPPLTSSPGDAWWRWQRPVATPSATAQPTPWGFESSQPSRTSTVSLHHPSHGCSVTTQRAGPTTYGCQPPPRLGRRRLAIRHSRFHRGRSSGRVELLPQ